MTNRRKGILYIGVTRNLLGRVLQHKEQKISGFTTKYNCTKLVYYEEYSLAMDAIKREKNLKKWKRAWKDNLIEKMNPEWKDLAIDWVENEFGEIPAFDNSQNMKSQE